MDRVVAESEAASPDADDPDPPLALGQPPAVAADTDPIVLKARFTGHSGGVSQEYPDRDEHAHPECGESRVVDPPLAGDYRAGAFWRPAMVAAAMDAAHGDGCAGMGTADIASAGRVARRGSATLLDRGHVDPGADRRRRLRVELVP